MKPDQVPSNRQPESFGRYLQSIRQDRGIGLKTVAADTRIRSDVLEKIELEDHSGLPDPVYVKGFLRAYANAIGADGAKAVALYESRLLMIKRLADAEIDLKRSARRFWPRLLFSLGLIIVLMIASVYGVSVYRHRSVPEPDPASISPAGPDSLPDDTGPSAADAEGGERRPAAAPPPPDDYLLKITSVEETWMQVTIDDQQPAEYTLNPGDYIELKAKSRFELLVGNAGGVQLTLNGKTVQVPGRRGEVASLQLP